MKIHNALFNAARLSEKAGKAEMAASFYSRSARGVGEQRAQALYRLANLEYQKGDLGDARQLLEEALELESKQPAWHYRLAMILEKEGDKEAALAHYRFCIRDVTVQRGVGREAEALRRSHPRQ